MKKKKISEIELLFCSMSVWFVIAAFFLPEFTHAQVFAPIAPGFPDAMSCVYSGFTGTAADTVVMTLAAVRNGDLSPEPGTGNTEGYEYSSLAGLMAFWSDGSYDNELGQICDGTPSTATDTSVFTLYEFGGSSATSTATTTFMYVENPDQNLAYAIALYFVSFFLIVWLMRKH